MARIQFQLHLLSEDASNLSTVLDNMSSSSHLKSRGPFPLIRVAESDKPSLQLHPSGQDLLSRLPPFPTTIIFAVGASRAGKSSLGNALLSSSFSVGHSFQPVTCGVDVGALIDLENEHILLFCDCEGSFHPTGGRQDNAYDLGCLGLLAYCCGDWVVHTSLGSVDERDVENLAYLAGAAGKHVQTKKRERAGSEEVRTSLMLLVNAPRFEEMLKEPEKTLGINLRNLRSNYKLTQTRDE